jgi:hypothetical protein
MPTGASEEAFEDATSGVRCLHVPSERAVVADSKTLLADK